jgi:hypothetical protein
MKTRVAIAALALAAALGTGLGIGLSQGSTQPASRSPVRVFIIPAIHLQQSVCHTARHEEHCTKESPRH